jgi:Fungal specific transcription factor domain
MVQFLTHSNPPQRDEAKDRRRAVSFIDNHQRDRPRPTALRVQALHGSTKCSSLEHERVRKGSRKVKLSNVIVNRDKYGLRDDPFNSFPISTSRGVKLAVDYCKLYPNVPNKASSNRIIVTVLSVYAPTHIFRPQALPREKGPLAVRSYLNYALQHPIMFESLIAVSKCHLTLQSGPSKLPQSEVYYHYGRTVTGLKEILDKGERQDLDAIIATILALMSIDVNLVPRHSYNCRF